MENLDKIKEAEEIIAAKNNKDIEDCNQEIKNILEKYKCGFNIEGQFLNNNLQVYIKIVKTN